MNRRALTSAVMIHGFACVIAFIAMASQSSLSPFVASAKTSTIYGRHATIATHPSRSAKLEVRATAAPREDRSVANALLALPRESHHNDNLVNVDAEIEPGALHLLTSHEF